MYYKRGEAFRYEFDHPLQCSFKIVEIDHKNIGTGLGNGEIIDLSPHGLRLDTDLNIPFGDHEVKLDITFKINSAVIETVGVLVWRKDHIQSHYQYGVEFVNSSEMYDIITEELKAFVKMKNL
jgi:hypothetical protein